MSPDSSDPLYWMRVILTSNCGTLMELGDHSYRHFGHDNAAACRAQKREFKISYYFLLAIVLLRLTLFCSFHPHHCLGTSHRLRSHRHRWLLFSSMNRFKKDMVSARVSISSSQSTLPIPTTTTMTTITPIHSTNDIDDVRLQKRPPQRIEAAVAAPTARAGPEVRSFFLNVFSFLLYWWVLKNLE